MRYKWKSNSLLKENRSCWVRWCPKEEKEGAAVWAARMGQTTNDKMAERSLLQAVGLGERTKETIEQTSLHSSRKQAPSPQTSKITGSREQTKCRKSFFVQNEPVLPGCWCRLHVMAGQAFSLQCAGKEVPVHCWQQLELAELLWSVVVGSCGPPSFGKQQAAAVEVLQTSPEPREKKERALLVSVPYLKRDSAFLPCYKPG